MRILWPILLLLPAGLVAQSVTVNGGNTTPPDLRPFGKYLAKVCVLTADGCAGSAVPDPAPPNTDKTPQTISIKQVGCGTPLVSSCPKPVYPLQVGSTFFVSATSDSGLATTQRVVSGGATLLPGSPTDPGTERYLVTTGSGPIIIRATQPGSDVYAAAVPAELTLAVATGAADAGATCSGLIPPATATQGSPVVDAAGIISLIGTPTPFVLTAQGKGTILIYSTRFPNKPDEDRILAGIIAQITDLTHRRPDSLGISAPAKPFRVELLIPHAAALGDLATRISGLNFSAFTVQDIGTDRVRITAASQPDCDIWTAFLSALRHMQWQVTPEPFNVKVFYISAADAATAFTSLAPAASAGPSTPAPSSGSPNTSTAPASPAAGAATIAVNQPPGSVLEIKSDTTPCVVAGLTLSNNSACSGTPGASAPPSSGGSSPGGGGAATAAPKAPSITSLAAGLATPDVLVFSDSNPGDDAQVMERKRILAQLDLPRPEMVINAWVMQNSTSDSRSMGAFSSKVRDLVAEYNDRLEELILIGWNVVGERATQSNFFDPDFYHYISDLYVADNVPAPDNAAVQDAAQSFLTAIPKLEDSPARRTDDFGICPSGRYCLGYVNLFHPVKPRLTDLLLTLIAARDPLGEANATINLVEGAQAPVADIGVCAMPPLGTPKANDRRKLQDRCRALWSNLGLAREPVPPPMSAPPLPPAPGERMPSCASLDYRGTLASLLTDPSPRPRVHLNCFRQALQKFLSRDESIGVIRSAIADFLFNYKMSQQYPHEFVPYDLSQSADSLNSALSPIIDAFNRDVAAFQTFLRADLQYQVESLNNDSDQRCCVKKLFGLDKPSFFNDGLVTVRTISGTPTIANTISQSSVDASTAPTLSSLLSSIASGGNGATPLSGVLGASPSSVGLLAGVLNAYQSSRASIGRQLNLQVTPRSLSTASSAELSVVLAADETAGGPTYTTGGTPNTALNTSRVASHDVTTRVRVESVKLFELSSFSAILQRSRSKFPLLPPFVEIPYIGTVLGIPIPGAKEYHASTAVISAMVVPTAADIAYGLRFVFDQVIDPASPTSCSYLKGSAGSSVASPCVFRRAVAIGDLARSPVRNFHKSIINCFATAMKSPYSSYGSLANTDTTVCRNLSFDLVPQSAF